jgi:hypothetical protein
MLRRLTPCRRRRPTPAWQPQRCKAWELSGAKGSVGNTTVIADGGYRGTGLIMEDHP